MILVEDLLAAHGWPFWLVLTWGVSSLILTFWIIMQRRAPVSTLAWIMVLNLLPFVGLLVYAYFGPRRVKRQRLKRWHAQASLMSQRDAQTLLDDRPKPPLWVEQHSRLIEATCGLPMCNAYDIELFDNGAQTLDAMLKAIAQAKNHIHLEYYIFEPDETGQRLLRALIERAREHIAVRLLVDAIGSARLLSRRQAHLLAEFKRAGGELAVFHPTRIDRLRPLVNLRTHRKIFIADGRIGMLGGVNITDAENDHIRPHDAYRDTHMLLRGSAVRWLQFIFLQDWQYASGRNLAHDGHLLPRDEPVGDVPVQIIASGPDSDGEAVHRAIIDALNLATERIWLSTPYFVPTEAAVEALRIAALRGVDVRIIVPEKSDSPITSAAARSYYRELQLAGVLIYEYRQRMFHPKTLVVDEQYSMLGSANFDNRSFRLNFEVMAAIFNHAVNQRLACMFEQDMQQSDLIAMGRRIWPHQKLFEALARLASPLL